MIRGTGWGKVWSTASVFHLNIFFIKDSYWCVTLHRHVLTHLTDMKSVFKKLNIVVASVS